MRGIRSKWHTLVQDEWSWGLVLHARVLICSERSEWLEPRVWSVPALQYRQSTCVQRCSALVSVWTFVLVCAYDM